MDCSDVSTAHYSTIQMKWIALSTNYQTPPLLPLSPSSPPSPPPPFLCLSISLSLSVSLSVSLTRFACVRILVAVPRSHRPGPSIFFTALELKRCCHHPIILLSIYDCADKYTVIIRWIHERDYAPRTPAGTTHEAGMAAVEKLIQLKSP